MHPNDLFESDAAYYRCFDENHRLHSIVFLTFLQNILEVMGVVLKKNLNLAPKAAGPKPSRLVYHAICLLCRHLAREESVDVVAKWGAKLHGRDPEFREEVRKIMNSNRSGIRTEIARQFMTLEASGADQLNAAFERCEKALGLKNGIDPFLTFADLDAQVPIVDGTDSIA
jgi:hypothetical protein